jgi:DnaK suppressor protein
MDSTEWAGLAGVMVAPSLIWLQRWTHRGELTNGCSCGRMELERARSRSSTERGQVQQLLAEIGKARTDDHEAKRDATYPAQSLAQQGVDDAVAAGLRDRLAALGRALQRVEDGSYGRSIRLACCCANFPLRQSSSGLSQASHQPGMENLASLATTSAWRSQV